MLHMFLQDSFLYYFSLKPVNSDDVPRVKSPLKKNRCKGRYPMGVRLSRFCGIPFSSPLGTTIHKRSRTTAINSQVSYMWQIYMVSFVVLFTFFRTCSLYIQGHGFCIWLFLQFVELCNLYFCLKRALVWTIFVSLGISLVSQS